MVTAPKADAATTTTATKAINIFFTKNPPFKINNNINNIENEQQGIEQKTYYIGNKNTKKFHTLDCYNLPKLENQIEFESSQQAVKEGYSPCKNCNPQ